MARKGAGADEQLVWLDETTTNRKYETKETNMPNANTTKVVTGKVRLSYCHVLEPYSASPDQPEKYSVTILIPKAA